MSSACPHSHPNPAQTPNRDPTPPHSPQHQPPNLTTPIPEPSPPPEAHTTAPSAMRQIGGGADLVTAVRSGAGVRGGDPAGRPGPGGRGGGRSAAAP